MPMKKVRRGSWPNFELIPRPGSSVGNLQRNDGKEMVEGKGHTPGERRAPFQNGESSITWEILIRRPNEISLKKRNARRGPPFGDPV